MNHAASGGFSTTGGMKAPVDAAFGARFENRYIVECHEFEGGPLLWREEIHNLVTTQGLNDTLTKYFAGSAYTAAWYVGLINNASFSALDAADVAAQIGGSNGWIEDTAYSSPANRATLTLGSASAGSISNSGSPASFTMNASGTLNGAFISSAASSTTGILYSEASFGATQPYVSGNVITVTATLTQS